MRRYGEGMKRYEVGRRKYEKVCVGMRRYAKV